MTDEDVCGVVTRPGPGVADQLHRQLVTDQLCAGSHNITAIRSIYRWRGEIYPRQEARVALHTRRSLVDRIVKRADREHPYEVPCVVSLPITDGDPAYLQWIWDETSQARSTES